MGALATIGEAHEGRAIYVVSQPGAFVHPSLPLARVQGTDDAEALEAVRKAFTVDDLRTFDQDPRFGAIVLSEVASRALSSAVNDPGTAIDMIGRAVRVLSAWATAEPDAPPARYAAVYVPPIELDELFDDVFGPIGRDGAGMPEVGIRLQKALLALALLDDPRYLAPAQHHSKLALERALGALTVEHDRARLRKIADEVAAIKPHKP